MRIINSTIRRELLKLTLTFDYTFEKPGSNACSYDEYLLQISFKTVQSVQSQVKSEFNTYVNRTRLQK